jgi:3-oxoadipate enol-lactonase / 4-carboxymuconolactone decarboxylase
MTICEVTHRVQGEPRDPPLVLANSLGADMSMWNPQAPALAQRFRLVRYDHRGQGASPVPPGPYEIADLGRDVIALLDRLELERVSFCGVSIGGMTGIWLAAHAPERIERLVVCCGSAYMPPASRWHERASAVREAGSVEVVADAVVANWLTPEFAETNPQIRARLRSMLVASPPDGYAEGCEAIARMDLRPELADIKTPTLVIGGERDNAAPVSEHGALIAKTIPNARLELVSAAHVANVEQPAAVLDLILDHLENEGAGMSDDPLYERGMKVRREVLGDEHVDRAIALTTPLTQPFQDAITRFAWGDVWSRETLDRRTRSAMTLAVLAALGREHELEMHVRAGLRHGLTPEEIGEVFLHTAVYAGLPAGNAALAIARRVLEEAQP